MSMWGALPWVGAVAEALPLCTTKVTADPSATTSSSWSAKKVAIQFVNVLESRSNVGSCLCTGWRKPDRNPVSETLSTDKVAQFGGNGDERFR